MPNSVTMIKRSSLILISSAAEAHFFVPEYHLTDIIYNTNMDSRKSCSTHSFLSFVWVPAGFGINCRYLFVHIILGNCETRGARS